MADKTTTDLRRKVIPSEVEESRTWKRLLRSLDKLGMTEKGNEWGQQFGPDYRPRRAQSGRHVVPEMNMKKKRSSPEPDWVRDDLTPRTTPYTDDELDLLTDGVIEGMKDTAAWRALIHKHGAKESRQIVRAGIFASGPSALNEKPNPN